MYKIFRDQKYKKQVKYVTNDETFIQLQLKQYLAIASNFVYFKAHLSYIQIISMKDSSKNDKKIINLFEYASQKQKPEIRKQISIHLKSYSQKYSQPSYGFDTLLHFNDSLNLSSIKSQMNNFSLQSQNQSIQNRTNKYQSFVQRVRFDAQKMKNKRIEQEAQWNSKKRKFNDIQKERELDESLAHSQVTSYNIDSQIYPLRESFKNNQKHQDHFAVQLKNQILKGKLKTFMNKIKDFQMRRFIKELILFDQILDFQKKCKTKIILNAFHVWKDTVQQVQSRRHIRNAIITRIKQRKQTKNHQQELQKFLNF